MILKDVLENKVISSDAFRSKIGQSCKGQELYDRALWVSCLVFLHMILVCIER